MHLWWQPRSACPGLTERSGWSSVLHFHDILVEITNTLLSWVVGRMQIWHSGLIIIVILLFNFDPPSNSSSRNLLSESVWVEKSWTWAVLGRGFPPSSLEGQGKSWPQGFQWEALSCPAPKTPRSSSRVSSHSLLSMDGRRSSPVSPSWIIYFRKRSGLIYNRRESVPVRIYSLGLLVERKGKLDRFLLARLWNI